ncbi:insulinase family protein [Fodinisporobacter ferrooxydans]|uniref:Insulinase family protein n=2 Tax=Fodinisporobacter ferrooxydans TaxID=2901836 RepID=A0ABY4CTB5_9BACL|nr:insulinase family protein [Alicyclobacillaceae bacterium MYW30-H2]
MRSVSLGVWVGTGSRFENEKNNGISHFIEHMFFKGTKNKTARQLAEVFDSIGGQVNAMTSKEYTCYYARVLDEHFEVALSTLADMFFQSIFAAEEVEKEKKVVIEEINMYEDTPDELVHDLLSSVVFQGHSLGYTILGPEENLKSFTRNDILEYMSNHYTPDNTVIAIAGNVSSKDAIAQVLKLFGHFSGKRMIKGGLAQPVFHVDRVLRQKDTEQAHICLATKGYPLDDKHAYPLILLNNALGSSSSSRLFQEIREERGMAYSVYSYHSSYQDIGMFGVYVGTNPEQMDEVVALTTSILHDVQTNGIFDEELKKAKDQVKGSLMLSLESTSSRMSRIGKNELLLQRQISLDETVEQINAVTPEQIQQVAHELFSQPIAITAVGPLQQLPGVKK